MNKSFKVALTTLGCKLNFSETSTISRQFYNEGYNIVKFDEFFKTIDKDKFCNTDLKTIATATKYSFLYLHPYFQ